MFRREMRLKRGSLPPKEGDLTCMSVLQANFWKILNIKNISML